MTQTPNPGQPLPSPSAPSAPGAYGAQSYPPAPQGASPAPYQPQGQYQPTGPAVPKPDSFMTNLFDTTRGFAHKYGNIIFILAVVAFLLGWFYSFYQVGSLHATVEVTASYDTRTHFNWARAFGTLMELPKVALYIGLVRLFIELVARTGQSAAPGAARPLS